MTAGKLQIERCDLTTGGIDGRIGHGTVTLARGRIVRPLHFWISFHGKPYVSILVDTGLEGPDSMVFFIATHDSELPPRFGPEDYVGGDVYANSSFHMFCNK